MSIQDRQGNYQKYNTDGTTPVAFAESLPSGKSLIGATMPMGDVAMVMRDSLTDPTHLLGANATYKSEVIDRPRQDVPDGMTRLWIKSSSTGVLYLEQHDNYNPAAPDVGWVTLATVNVSATVSALMAWSTLTKQYVRFKFVNGAVPQTEFILNHYTQGVGVTPVMVADGADVTQGAKNETPVTDPTASASVTARLGGLLKQAQGGGPAGTAMPVSVVGSLPNQTLAEQKTQADAVVNVITFSANLVAVEIYHEEVTWQDFIVNGITIKIPAGGYRTPIGGVAGATVTIPNGISCIVGRLV